MGGFTSSTLPSIQDRLNELYANYDLEVIGIGDTADGVKLRIRSRVDNLDLWSVEYNASGLKRKLDLGKDKHIGLWAGYMEHYKAPTAEMLKEYIEQRLGGMDGSLVAGPTPRSGPPPRVVPSYVDLNKYGPPFDYTKYPGKSKRKHKKAAIEPVGKPFGVGDRGFGGRGDINKTKGKVGRAETAAEIRSKLEMFLRDLKGVAEDSARELEMAEGFDVSLFRASLVSMIMFKIDRLTGKR